jgi:phytanoyl-CoA hydroxylase
MSVRVFYESTIAPHDPELYSFERIDDGITPQEALSEAGLARWRDEGFLNVRGLLPLAEVQAARAELEAMALSEKPDCELIYYEGALRQYIQLDAGRDQDVDGNKASVFGFQPGQQGDGLPPVDPKLRARYVRKFMSFVGMAPELTRLSKQPSLMAIVTRLLGGQPPEMFQDMALVKPGGGREKPWHQDHAYFNVALDTPIVGVWIPMGEVTPENGCMHMLAGGHRAGPRIHFKRRDWQICDSDIDARGRVAVPMAPGDVLLFDGKLPHGTPTNRTDEHRWAVQYHYRPGTAVLTDDEDRLAAFGSEGRDVSC